MPTAEKTAVEEIEEVSVGGKNISLSDVWNRLKQEKWVTPFGLTQCVLRDVKKHRRAPWGGGHRRSMMRHTEALVVTLNGRRWVLTYGTCDPEHHTDVSSEILVFYLSSARQTRYGKARQRRQYIRRMVRESEDLRNVLLYQLSQGRLGTGIYDVSHRFLAHVCNNRPKKQDEAYDHVYCKEGGGNPRQAKDPKYRKYGVEQGLPLRLANKSRIYPPGATSHIVEGVMSTLWNLSPKRS